MPNKLKKRKNSPTTTALIGALLALVGGFFVFYNYIESKKIVAYDYMARKFYETAETTEITQIVEVETNEILETEDFYKPNQELSGEITDDYIGYLTIPKINFMKGFLDSRSKENNVDKNIMVIEGSNYPDVDKGNFIIAGHSGTGWKAFFSELHKIQVGDLAYVDYKGKKYTYKVKEIYTQPKTGKLTIHRDYNQTTLTLITCTTNSSTTQTIYNAELISIEE